MHLGIITRKNDMLSQNTFKFLRDLKKNNNRDWFSVNKNRYEEAKKEFDDFVNSVIQQMGKFDKAVRNLEAKDCVFRIYRDVRFSKDKSPYKTHFGAHIVAGGKKMKMSRAGYYIHISPAESFLGGGAYAPPAEWINAIRKEIHYNVKQLKRVIQGKDFKKYFGEIEGEKLSRPPHGYEKDHLEIELLKHKNFLATHSLTEKHVLSKNFISHTTRVFKALKPFDTFLNQSLD